MPLTTTPLGLPYPQESDPNDFPADMAALAAKLNTVIGRLRFDVKDYGAAGDGVADDTAEILAAHTAAAAVDGVVFFPPGVYVCNNLSTPNSATDFVTWQGSGMDSTIIKGTLLQDHVVSFRCNGAVNDITFDGGGAGKSEVVCYATTLGSVVLDHVEFNRCRFTNCDTGANGNVFNAWDQAYTTGPLVTHWNELWMNDCLFDGPSATAHDAVSIAGIKTVRLRNCAMRNLARTPNVYACDTLIVDGLKVTGTTGTSDGFTVDSLVNRCFIRGMVHADTGAGKGAVLNSPITVVSDSYFGTEPKLNVANLATFEADFSGCTFAFGIAVQKAFKSLRIRGGKIVVPAGPAGAITDNSGATLNGLEVIGTAFDLTAGTRLISANNGAITVNGSGFAHCPMSGGTPSFSNVTFGAGFGLRFCAGYNPRGFAVTQPAVAATTVAVTNTTGVDCAVFITGGTVTVVSIGGTATGLTSGSFRVPAGQTIAITYSVAPTWKWFGD